jgi:hypothetical protein
MQGKLVYEERALQSEGPLAKSAQFFRKPLRMIKRYMLPDRCEAPVLVDFEDH